MANGMTQRPNGNKRKGKAKPTIPMANASSKRRKSTKYKQVQKGENEIVVSGRDLVVPTPQNLPQGQTPDFTVFQMVPANPTYWEGTRIQKIAQTYQLYRPLKFKVHYHPQVPVTNPGLVVYGTLYQDQSTSGNALQQVLNTSNGGGIKECYSPFTSVVNVGDKYLQMRTYNTVGSTNDTANNPFSWCATYSGFSASAISTSSCPGWVEVEWTYRFVNGLPGPGNSSRGTYTVNSETLEAYNRLRPRSAARINWDAPFGVPIGILKAATEPLLRHVSCVLLKETKIGPIVLGIGKALNWMISQAGTRSSTTLVTDDSGREIELPDDTPVVVFQSGLPQATLAVEPGLRYIESIDITTDGSLICGGNSVNAAGHVNVRDPEPSGSQVDLMGRIRLSWTSEDDKVLFHISSATETPITSGSVNFQLMINDMYVANVRQATFVNSSNNLICLEWYPYDSMFAFA